MVPTNSPTLLNMVTANVNPLGQFLIDNTHHIGDSADLLAY